MKKTVVITLICLFISLLLCIVYPIFNTMSIEITDYDINNELDINTIDAFCNNLKNKNTTSQLKDTLNNYYLITLRFNVINNHNFSYRNWKVYEKHFSKEFTVLFNDYKVEGANYYIQKNSSVNNLGMNVLVYAEGKTIENIRNELIPNIVLFAIGFPAL